MTTAHAIALALLPVLTVGSCVLALLFPRIRDIFFFILVSVAVLSEHLDVHFDSMEWYRGTTRGFEISLLAILAFAILIGGVLGRVAPRPRLFWPASLGFLLCYALYATATVCMDTPRIFGAFELLKIYETIIVFLAAAFYLRSLREWRLLVVALAFDACFEGAWALKQRIFTHVVRPPASLDHANSLSMYLCLIGPLLMAVAHKGWSRPIRWLCGIAVLAATAGVVLSLSRTGVPLFVLLAIGVTVCCGTLVPTPKRLAAAITVTAAIAIALGLTWKSLAQRYEEASLDEEYLDTTGEGRGVYFRLAHAIVEDHPLGIGLNNWSYYVSRIYGPEIGFRYTDYQYIRKIYGDNDYAFVNAYLPAPAHDLACLTIGELGIPGLILFLALWARWAWMGIPYLLRGRKDIDGMLGTGLFFCICGIFGQSITEWVYRQTPILFTFYILMGGLAALVHARRTSPEEI